jgi:ABC-2 type transport system permease protein
MNIFRAAFWAELLKARRSKITPLTSAGFMLLPLVGGLFMIILKYPEEARSLGLITTKAQLTAGVADWPTFFGILLQGMAISGAILFALITAWVFGREFSDHTAKELLALPTPRWVIVAAKFTLIGLWTLALSLLVFAAGVAVGALVDIPGWSAALGWSAFQRMLLIALLTVVLTPPFVALFASAGRGYLPPMGWTFLIVALANILSVLGYGDWFPWAVPVLVSGSVKAYADLIGVHSYAMVLLAFLAGAGATFAWWRSADQTR